VPNPYRVPGQPPVPAERAEPRSWDEFAILALLVAIGAIRAIPALLRHEEFGASATVALFMVVLGLTGLGFDLRHRLRRGR
jgi:hypothetical protein